MRFRASKCLALLSSMPSDRFFSNLLQNGPNFLLSCLGRRWRSIARKHDSVKNALLFFAPAAVINFYWIQPVRVGIWARIAGHDTSMLICFVKEPHIASAGMELAWRQYSVIIARFAVMLSRGFANKSHIFGFGSIKGAWYLIWCGIPRSDKTSLVAIFHKFFQW